LAFLALHAGAPFVVVMVLVYGLCVSVCLRAMAVGPPVRSLIDCLVWHWIVEEEEAGEQSVVGFRWRDKDNQMGLMSKFKADFIGFWFR
jgi:hypothetical protein